MMVTTARDVMCTDVLSVSPEEPLLQVHRLFVDEEITGAPVVDQDGRVLGVISSADLLRAVAEDHEAAATSPVYLRELIEFSGPDWGIVPQDFQDRLSQLTAADAMSDRVIAVEPDTALEAVARTLRFHRIHRVLVEERGRLVGIITTFDLMRFLEKHGSGA
jgi:predicted transcriptional regulator